MRPTSPTSNYTTSSTPGTTQQLSWLAAAVGLGLHTLVDGVALAASVEAESAHAGTGLALAGLGNVSRSPAAQAVRRPDP